MGWLLPALTQAKFDNQRDVVLNERRQNYENRPYGLAQMAIARALYPAGAPVSLADDRRSRTTSGRDARRGARRSSRATTTRPTRRSCWRATSTPTEGFDLAERYFGDIPRGPDGAAPEDSAPWRGTPSPAGARGPRRVPAAVPGLALARPVRRRRRGPRPAGRRAGQRQDLAPLPRRSCHERRIALDVAASQNSRESGGLFQVVSTAAAPDALAEIDRGDPRGDRSPGVERGRPPTSSRAGLRRPRPTSSTACRRSAASAASRTSSTPTTCSSASPGTSTRTSPATGTPTLDSVRRSAAAFLRPPPAATLSVVPIGRAELALRGSEAADVR